MIVDRMIRRAGQLRRDVWSGGWGPWADGRIPPPGVESPAGMIVTERTALRLSAVWACVSLIAEDIAGLPIGEYRKDGNARIELDDPPLFQQPHPEIPDYVDWATRILTSLLLAGNAYGFVDELDRAGLPSAILPLAPRDVIVRRDRSGRVTYKVGSSTELAWPAGPIWHVRGLTLPGEIVGCSPIEHARQTIGLGLAAEEFGANFFAEGAAPSGILKLKDDLRGEAGEEKARRILTNFERRHGGRHRRTALLSGGAEWSPVSVTPNEAQFLETRRYSVGDVARLYRVPPHLIGDVERSTSWGTGIEQQSIGYVVHTLGPWIRRLETALTRLRPAGRFVRVNVAGLLRGDLKSRYESYAIGRQWGWLSVNDILALEDRPPIDNGDTYLQPLNMVPAGTQVLRDRATPDERAVWLARLAQIREITDAADDSALTGRTHNGA